MNKDKQDEADGEVNESLSLKETHSLLLALKGVEPGIVVASGI